MTTKRKRVQVSEPDIYIWSGEGDTLVGTYSGNGTTAKKDGEIIKTIHIELEESGKMIALFSTWALQRVFDDFKGGELVEIIYKGETKLAQGSVKKFDVYLLE